jgi:hypothetical protein
MQAFDGLKIIKPCRFTARLFFVAEGNEISNLRLIEDIDKILGFIETELSII